MASHNGNCSSHNGQSIYYLPWKSPICILALVKCDDCEWAKPSDNLSRLQLTPSSPFILAKNKQKELWGSFFALATGTDRTIVVILNLMYTLLSSIGNILSYIQRVWRNKPYQLLFPTPNHCGFGNDSPSIILHKQFSRWSPFLFPTDQLQGSIWSALIKAELKSWIYWNHQSKK